VSHDPQQHWFNFYHIYHILCDSLTGSSDCLSVNVRITWTVCVRLTCKHTRPLINYDIPASRQEPATMGGKGIFGEGRTNLGQLHTVKRYLLKWCLLGFLKGRDKFGRSCPLRLPVAIGIRIHNIHYNHRCVTGERK